MGTGGGQGQQSESRGAWLRAKLCAEYGLVTIIPTSGLERSVQNEIYTSLNPRMPGQPRLAEGQNCQRRRLQPGMGGFNPRPTDQTWVMADNLFRALIDPTSPHLPCTVANRFEHATPPLGSRAARATPRERTESSSPATKVLPKQEASHRTAGSPSATGPPHDWSRCLTSTLVHHPTRLKPGTRAPSARRSGRGCIDSSKRTNPRVASSVHDGLAGAMTGSSSNLLACDRHGARHDQTMA